MLSYLFSCGFCPNGNRLEAILSLTELNKMISLQERVYRKRKLKSMVFFFNILTLSLHGWKISLTTTTKQCLVRVPIWNVLWQWMVWKLPCIQQHNVHRIFVLRTSRLFQAKLYSFLREDINLCLHFFVFPCGGRISRHVEINNVLVPWATRFF